MVGYALILTLIVTCSNFYTCGALPFEKDETNIDNNGMNDVSTNRKFIYKLPTVVTDGLTITIEGNITGNDKTFTAVLPSNSGGTDCKIVYDFAKNTLDVMPASAPDSVPAYYSLKMLPDGMTTFFLRLKARTANGKQIFDFTFEGNRHLQNGPSEPLACLASFTDISHIIMTEGVKSVKELLFEFPK